MLADVIVRGGVGFEEKKRSKHTANQLQERIQLGAVTKEYKAHAKQLVKELKEL